MISLDLSSRVENVSFLGLNRVTERLLALFPNAHGGMDDMSNKLCASFRETHACKTSQRFLDTKPLPLAAQGNFEPMPKRICCQR
jgi:hypothetical protein